jgi:hypothetical protein
VAYYAFVPRALVLMTIDFVRDGHDRRLRAERCLRVLPRPKS